MCLCINIVATNLQRIIYFLVRQKIRLNKNISDWIAMIIYLKMLNIMYRSLCYTDLSYSKCCNSYLVSISHLTNHSNKTSKICRALLEKPGRSVVFFLWTTTHRYTNVGWPAKLYINQLWVDPGCHLDNLQRAIADRKGLQERFTDAVLNRSWKRQPTKQWRYGYLPPITQTIQIR